MTGGKRPGGTQDWKTAGGPGRDHNILMELELDKVTSTLPTAAHNHPYPSPILYLLVSLSLSLYISILQSSLLFLYLLHGVSPHPFLLHNLLPPLEFSM